MLKLIAIVCGFTMDLIYENPIIKYSSSKNIKRRFEKLNIKKNIKKMPPEKQYRLGRKFLCTNLILRILLVLFLWIALKKLHFQITLALETIIYFLIFSANPLFKFFKQTRVYIKNNQYIDAKKTIYPFTDNVMNYKNKNELIISSLRIFSENTSKFIISPTFYTCIGELYLGMIYKNIAITQTVGKDSGQDFIIFNKYATKLVSILNVFPNFIFNSITLVLIRVKKLNYNSAKLFYKKYNHKKPTDENKLLFLMCLLSIKQTNENGDNYVTYEKLLKIENIIKTATIIFFIISLLLRFLIIYLVNKIYISYF